MRIEFDRIHNIIRDRICLLEYRPGTVIHEGRLAQEFDVSRTPIREILQRLGFAGLLEARNGVGTIVTERTLDEIRQIYEIRLQIAALIGDLTPRHCQDEDIAIVKTLLERARDLQDNFNLREYWRINHETHFAIARLIGNAPLMEMWDRYYFQIASFWYQVVESGPVDVSKSLVREMEDVLEAMSRDDVAAVGYIERNYISYGFDRVMALYAENPVMKVPRSCA
jgi:DNA-binding GntR family transcriptional regulator